MLVMLVRRKTFSLNPGASVQLWLCGQKLWLARKSVDKLNALKSPKKILDNRKLYTCLINDSSEMEQHHLQPFPVILPLFSFLLHVHSLKGTFCSFSCGFVAISFLLLSIAWLMPGMRMNWMEIDVQLWSIIYVSKWVGNPYLSVECVQC